MEIVQIFEQVFSTDRKLATENAVPGARVYKEKLYKIGNREYREWDPYRSKLAGAIKKGLKEFPIKRGMHVLYLGASTGTTASHVSDIIGNEGTIFCVEISAQSMNALLQLSEKRKNFVPILEDARKPDNYADVGAVDVIYQDVSQPDQDDILIANSQKFLKKDGMVMFCVKSQSINVLEQPQEVFRKVKNKLAPFFDIIQELKLEPYDKDHLFLVLKKK